MVENAPQTSPRGTDRVRRRKTQAENAEKAKVEIASLASPEGPDKQAAIAAKTAKVARFGASPGGVRRARQIIHREQAEAEPAKLATTPVSAPRLVPGEQVSLRTANLVAQASDVSEKDFETEAARAAGVAVRDTLRGKPLRDRHNRSRHIAQHNAKVAAREAAAAK